MTRTPQGKGTATLSTDSLDKPDRRLNALVRLVLLLGLSTVALSVAGIAGALGAPAARPPLPWLVAYVALVALAIRLSVTVRVRSTSFTVAWTDAVILVGLALMPAAWIALATTIGVTLGMATTHRLRPVQVAFASAKDTTTTFIGGLILISVAGAGPPLSVGVIGIYAVAFAAMTVVDMALVNPVIALASRTPVMDRLRANWDIRIVTLVGRFVVAVAAIAALRSQPLLLYLLPLVVLIAHLWHERWVRAREERQAWQDLAAATESFSGVELDAVLRAAVTRGAKLFSADEVEVEIWADSGHRLVRGAEEITYDGDPAGAPVDTTNIYAVALHGYQAGRDIGALRLRFHRRTKIAEREQAMLASFAAALDTAIRNAAAYGQLGEATAAHAHAAAHDPLTGLANRRELERHLAEALATDTSLDCRVALLLLDLKHFKEVNDTLGHLTGDRVLVQIAHRLAGAARPRDLVARFGGDEFAVLLRHAYRPERVETRAAGVLAALADPLTVDGLPIVVEANAGLALAIDPRDEADEDGDSDPDRDAEAFSDTEALSDTEADGDSDTGGDGNRPGRDRPGFRRDPSSWMAELMRRADVAMYQAKRHRRPLASYSPLNDTGDRHRLELSGQLGEAVSQRQFVLRFQPIVDLVTGDVHSAEALARWRHPTRGQLEPRWFLDLIERSQHLQAFTEAVLDGVLSAADMWRAAGHDLSVSVNISARSLLDPQLPRLVLDALSNHRTPPRRLCLELTESLAISQLETVDQVLTQLHDIGVQLALDDFGTGYSSLAALSRIPVHQLKIDRSFVKVLRDFGTGDGQPGAADLTQARAVVRSTVQLGRTLDLAVVAEGVENLGQRRLLCQLGCEFGQGNLFSRPIPADGLLDMLTRGVGDRSGALAEPIAGAGNVVAITRPRSPGDGPRADGHQPT
jgi:diguanylate cyclase